MVNKKLVAMAGKMISEDAKIKIKKDSERKAPEYPQFMDTKKAETIRKALIEKVRFDKTLIRESTMGPDLISSSNFSYAILSYLLGYERKSAIVRESAVNRIGSIRNSDKNQCDLIKYSANESGLTTHANTSLAILDYLLDQKDEAIKRKNTIEAKIGFKGNLIKSGVISSGLYTQPNSSFGILSYLVGDETMAKKIREEIIKKIGFEGNLIKSGIGDDGLDTSSNAQFATLDYLLGFKEEAKNILEGIEKRIGFEGDLIKSRIERYELDSNSNSTLGILYVTDKLKQIYEDRNGK